MMQWRRATSTGGSGRISSLDHRGASCMTDVTELDSLMYERQYLGEFEISR